MVVIIVQKTALKEVWYRGGGEEREKEQLRELVRNLQKVRGRRVRYLGP